MSGRLGSVERFELWSQARLQWAKEHPGSVLGSVLDVLREHRRMREEHFGWKY
jgi:hypothetical protein